MRKRSPGDYLLLGLRGMAMGSADLVPGVSGGTIAFITGIYKELIDSIRSINAGLFKTLFREGIASVWKKVNGPFLLAVISGILVSIFSLARLISWLLDHHAMLVWAFFFGLIIGSVFYVLGKIDRWSWLQAGLLLFGLLLAYYITVTTPAITPETLWFVFISGSIALCALILPGISGAFILVLLGKYEYMLNAVRDLNVSVIVVFAVGGVLGVIGFSNIIGWFFRKYPNGTLALLSGFMAGSLNKLWPWKEVLETRLNSAGEEVPFLEKSISPWEYASLYGQDPMVLPVILSAISGLALILLFTRMARQ